MKMKSIIQAASMITVLAIISKVLGVVRVSLMSSYYGRSVEADAFALAFAILEFLRHFIAGGTLVSAIIPVFSALLHDISCWRIPVGIIHQSISAGIASDDGFDLHKGIISVFASRSTGECYPRWTVPLVAVVGDASAIGHIDGSESVIIVIDVLIG